jgi:leucyl/phenylalanyl-tRNA---protein transferase
MPHFLAPNQFHFPDIQSADEDGLLAMTEDFTSERILAAYRAGAFPWFRASGFYWWFAPNPRCVLFPNNLKISKSMRQIINGKQYTFTINKCFTEVIKACANTVRKPVFMDGVLNDNNSTWIDETYIEAYSHLHQMGYCMSAETWYQNKLVGGLYGMFIGKVFFGESMFSIMPNASKFALIELVQFLKQNQDLQMIDCQQPTPHLLSLGAECIDTLEFKNHLDAFLQKQ